MIYYRHLRPFFITWYRAYSILLVGALVLSLVLAALPAVLISAPNSQVQPVLLDLAAQHPEEHVNVIVQKKVSSDEVEKKVVNLGGVVTGDLHIINGFTAKIPARSVPQLNQVSGIRWVSYDGPVIRPSFSWDCQDCFDSNNLLNNYNSEVKSDKVWMKDGAPWLTGKGVGVAVVDSGINPQQDFYTIMGNLRVTASVAFNYGWNQTIYDWFGHGDHIAGIIGGNGGGSDGTYIGIAPATNLLNVKVAEDDGQATASNVIKGLQWIYDNRTRYNIRVANISLNSSVKSDYNTDPLCAAAEILWFNGVVVVASAGNNGDANLFAPANDPFVITVGAVDDKGNSNLSDDAVANYSAYGIDQTGAIKPDIVAPGKNIISVSAGATAQLSLQHPANNVGLDRSYFRMSGTSTAAPMVAGAAALLLQSEPNLNPDQVKYRLMVTAVQNSPRWSGDTRPVWPGYTNAKAGAGYLDIYAAVTNKKMGNTPNYGKPASKLLWTGNTPVAWGSVNWTSVNWTSVNWTSVNWTSVNWSSDYWGSD